MITCDLIGRCGNQLFQIATTCAHAWRMGEKFAFPRRAIGSYTGEVYFPRLPVVPPVRFPVYAEPSHSYTPIPDLHHVKLHGYWQSEKYFKDYRDKVIELFHVPIQSDMKQYVSVHVRRTDYLEMTDKHPPITKEYIHAALEHFGKDYEPLFFSDDIKWCQDNFKGSFCTNTHPVQSIGIMASCSHNIIANSSFSWWGAWLNPNPDKIVIAPSVWFGPGNAHLDHTDIYCEKWIIL